MGHSSVGTTSALEGVTSAETGVGQSSALEGTGESCDRQVTAVEQQPTVKFPMEECIDLTDVSECA